MEYLKKNYEKILLIVVFLGLAIAACYLPFFISSKREELRGLVYTEPPPAKPLTNVDTTTEDSALARINSQEKLDFTNKHNLFNPVVWKQLSGGGLLKETTGNEEGPQALEVTAIKPLYLIISYGSPNETGYIINIERQAAPSESKRHAEAYVSSEHKSDLLALLGIKGAPDNPTELDLEWDGGDNPQNISITPTKPFRQVEGYSADLKYPLEAGKVWTDRRVGGYPLRFAGGSYNIVAISETNVVISDQSNDKKTTISFHPATESR